MASVPVNAGGDCDILMVLLTVTTAPCNGKHDVVPDIDYLQVVCDCEGILMFHKPNTVSHHCSLELSNFPH